MPNFDSLIVKIVGDSSSFSKAMDTASSKATAFSSRAKAIGGGMSKYVSLPLAAAGVASVKFAADFEQSLQRAVSVTGLTGKAAGEARSQMSALASQLGAETAFSAKEAADAMYDLASSGWDTKQMASGLPGIMSLAAATQSDLAATTGTVTSTLAQFGLAASDSGHVADVFTKAISATRAQMSDLSAGMKTVGPVAKSVGWSVEETTAAISSLADAGISGAEGGTALRGAIASLLNPVGQGAEALKELGLSADDVNPKTHSLAQILDILKKAGMDANTATQIFGREGVASMQALAGQGAPALNKLTTELEKSGGTAKQVAEQQMRTLSGQLEQLKGSAETAAIAFGTVLIPVLTRIAQALIPAVNWFTNLPGPIKTAAVAIAGIAVAAGPLIWALGAIVGAASTVGPVLLAIAAVMTGPLGLAVLGIIATIGILVHNWDRLRALGGPVQNAMGGVANTFRAVLGPAIAWVRTQVQGMVQWFTQNLPLMQRTAQTVLGAIAGIFRVNLNIVMGIVRAVTGEISAIWQAHGTQLKAIAQSVWNIIRGTISTALRIIGNVIKLAMQVITGNWQGAWNTIKRIGELAMNQVKTVITNGLNIVKNLFKITTDAVINTWNAFKNLVISAATALKDGAVNRFEEMKNGVVDRVTALKTGAMNAIEALQSGARNVWDAMLTGAKNFGDDVKSTIVGAFEATVNGARKWLGGLATAMGNFLGDLGLPGAETLKEIGANLEKPLQFARGGIMDVDRGGVGTGRKVLAITNEAGPEAVVRLDKYTPASAKAAQAVLDSPNSPLRRAGNPGEVTPHRSTGRRHRGMMAFAPGGVWWPNMASVVAEVEKRFGYPGSTYEGHPTHGAAGSADFLISGAWGSPASESEIPGGNSLKSFLHANWGKIPGDYIIWQNMIGGPGGYSGFGGAGATDGHYDHLHFTAAHSAPPVEGFAAGGGAEGGGFFDAIGAVSDFMSALKPFPDLPIQPLSTGLKDWAGDLLNKVKDWLIDKAKDVIGIGDSGGTTPFTGDWASATGGSPSTNRGIGRAAAEEMGWSAQWPAWEELGNRESGWDRYARNPSSGAYGIPQALPESKLPAAGQSSGGSNAGPQVAWMANYIKDRYGDPQGALAFHNANNWYAKGGLGTDSPNTKMHLWNEQQGNEAFIPERGITRGRGLGLLSKAAEWYNASVVPFAKGGLGKGWNPLEMLTTTGIKDKPKTADDATPDKFTVRKGARIAKAWQDALSARGFGWGEARGGVLVPLSPKRGHDGTTPSGSLERRYMGNKWSTATGGGGGGWPPKQGWNLRGGRSYLPYTATGSVAGLARTGASKWRGIVKQGSGGARVSYGNPPPGAQAVTYSSGNIVMGPGSGWIAMSHEFGHGIGLGHGGFSIMGGDQHVTTADFAAVKGYYGITPDNAGGPSGGSSGGSGGSSGGGSSGGGSSPKPEPDINWLDVGQDFFNGGGFTNPFGGPHPFGDMGGGPLGSGGPSPGPTGPTSPGPTGPTSPGPTGGGSITTGPSPHRMPRYRGPSLKPHNFGKFGESYSLDGAARRAGMAGQGSAIGGSDGDKGNEKMEQILEDILEKTASKDELTDAFIAGAGAMHLSDFAGDVTDKRLAASMKRIKQLINK